MLREFCLRSKFINQIACQHTMMLLHIYSIRSIVMEAFIFGTEIKKIVLDELSK